MKAIKEWLGIVLLLGWHAHVSEREMMVEVHIVVAMGVERGRKKQCREVEVGSSIKPLFISIPLFKKPLACLPGSDTI